MKHKEKLIADLQAGYEFKKAHIAELESLRAENAMLKSSGIDKVVNIIAETEVWKECETLRARLAEIEAQEPVAWMRKWAFDGETPVKERNSNGRMAWPHKFKILPVTEGKFFNDDVGLYSAPVVSPDVEKLKSEIADLQAENETLRARLAELENQDPASTVVGHHFRYGSILGDTLEPGTKLFAAPAVSPDVEKLKAEIVSLRQQICASQSNVMARDEYIQSLTTELVAARKDAEWQPIETAPKTGRELILLLTPSNFPQVAYSNTWWTSGFSAENKPTHWKPLPEPPAIEQAKGGV